MRAAIAYTLHLMARSENKYFAEPSPQPEHPRLRAWKAYRRMPPVHHVDVEVKKGRDGLTLLPPRLFVTFYDEKNEIVKQDEAPWEAELDDWLIDEEKARAVTPANEKDRFSLVLKPALRPTIVRYGDGYFNSVLIETLKNGPYRDHIEVADMLRSIHEYPPAGGSKDDCRDEIEHVFSKTAQRLLALYMTDRTAAVDILGGAISRYLDERFSVTNSRMLGLA